MMKPIFLVGYMCSGKSTLGPEVARLLGREFIDLDDYIEAQQGCTIVDLFARVGEAKFRVIETAALHEVATRDNAVISCGGGTPCHSGNMDYINEHGTSVWLHTSAERIIARLCLPEHRSKRPATATLTNEQIAAMVNSTIDSRQPFYSMAHISFDSTHIETAEETVDTAILLAHILLADEEIHK